MTGLTRPRLARQVPALALLLLAALTLPADALAARIRIEKWYSDEPRRLVYYAEAGEVNELTVERVGTDYRFQDTGATLTSDEATGCRASGPSDVTCPGAELWSAFVDLGDGEDTARLPRSDLYQGLSAYGGDGADRLLAGYGVRGQTLYGGRGDDVLIGGRAGDDLLGGPGDDLLKGGGGNDALHGDAGRDVLRGERAGDKLEGEDPLPSHDVRVQPAADVLDGGLGRDLATYEAYYKPVRLDLRGRSLNGRPGEGDELVGIENLTGGSANDVLIGNGATNVLESGYGDDVMRGEGGDDRLNGERGWRELSGGPGRDILLAADYSEGQLPVNCGPDVDMVHRPYATLMSNCERVGIGFTNSLFVPPCVVTARPFRLQLREVFFRARCREPQKVRLLLQDAMPEGRFYGSGKGLVGRNRQTVVRVRLGRRGREAVRRGGTFAVEGQSSCCFDLAQYRISVPPLRRR